MNEEDVKRYALICAVNAEIEAMKAANAQNRFYETGPMYLKEQFIEKAEELGRLAYAPEHQL